jgi:hypothetical protein
MGDSLVPAVPQSRRSANVEVLVSLILHVITLVVDVGELGQAEITVHDVGDVPVRSLCFFLI